MARIKPEVHVDNTSTRRIPGIKQPVEGFMKFMNRYSILSLAIGVIIGQTTKDTVNKLVSGIITPGIQLLLPSTQLQDLVIKTGNAEFQIGEFLNSIIELIIVMLLIYITFGIILKRKDLLETKPRTLPKAKKTKPQKT